MEFQIEELLPLIERLTFQYTSGDSSSITYETARMLMEAILYSIKECERESSKFAVRTEERLKPEVAYNLGQEAVIAKVYQTKELYHALLEEFQDYGVKNLKDTVIEGMPAFFIHYDPKFKPQDHLLTLDYPTMGSIAPLCGIDAIYQYLKNMKIECDFLKAFDPLNIKKMLERIQPDYQNLYYDNVCDAVLLTIVGCYGANKPVGSLELEVKDMKAIKNYFKCGNREETENTVNKILQELFKRVFQENDKMMEYFMPQGKNYAARIINGAKNDSLSGVFGI
ncbi:MAG: hypothetical protein K0R21_2180 [Anaerocolumna sp.]|jgi:hypothetical protein|nr:hypothetical protein [Anaerocolumna sp.]